MTTSVDLTFGDYIEVIPPPEIALPLAFGGTVFVSAYNEAGSSRPKPFPLPIGTSSNVIKQPGSSAFTIRITGFITSPAGGIASGSALQFSIEQLRTPLTT